MTKIQKRLGLLALPLVIAGVIGAANLSANNQAQAAPASPAASPTGSADNEKAEANDPADKTTGSDVDNTQEQNDGPGDTQNDPQDGPESPDTNKE